ncbi:hypothetical protein [Herbidospora yilanensis]|uniref:hypothetical protein n=1 Tax=Herbidospora yilanensis TaxID=354426 RepID=UPI000785CF14|nr:hypothetical protein [Herbidospora yilanensis]
MTHSIFSPFEDERAERAGRRPYADPDSITTLVDSFRLTASDDDVRELFDQLNFHLVAVEKLLTSWYARKHPGRPLPLPRRPTP